MTEVEKEYFQYAIVTRGTDKAIKVIDIDAAHNPGTAKRLPVWRRVIAKIFGQEDESAEGSKLPGDVHPLMERIHGARATGFA